MIVVIDSCSGSVGLEVAGLVAGVGGAVVERGVGVIGLELDTEVGETPELQRRARLVPRIAPASAPGPLRGGGSSPSQQLVERRRPDAPMVLLDEARCPGLAAGDTDVEVLEAGRVQATKLPLVRW